MARSKSSSSKSSSMKMEVVPDRYEYGKVAVFVHHQIKTLDWDFHSSREKRKGLYRALKDLRGDFLLKRRSWILHETPNGFHAVGEGPEGLPTDLVGYDEAYLRLRGNSFCWRVTPKADGLPAAFGKLKQVGAPLEELLKEVKKYLLVAKSATNWDLSYREIGWFEDAFAFEWRGQLRWVVRSEEGYWKGSKAPEELSFKDVNDLKDLAWDMYQAKS